MNWEKLDCLIGDTIPPCLKAIVNECGYDNMFSLELLDEEKVNEIEQYISENRSVIDELNCCFSEEYKNQTNFKFLPGHKTLLLSLPKYIAQFSADSVAHSISERNESLSTMYSVILSELMKTAECNSSKNKNHAEYSEIIRQFSTYIYLLSGKCCYETLNRNLPIPSVKTIQRNIENNQKRIIEGELRSQELAVYLEKLKTEKIVWISEDATAIVPRVNYDSATDQIIGLVLPVNKRTGCPISFSYKASTVDEIVSHSKKDKAKLVYLVMAQPLDERLPPFILQIFGLDSTFTSQTVINRWNHTITELNKHGIRVAGISSDGDPRLLSAMCRQYLNPSFYPCFFQDMIHIATKLRNRLLKLCLEMKFGAFKVSLMHLKRLIACCPKEIHGLTMTDVSPNDRQNFSSFEKIVSRRVLNALEVYVPGSEATVKYLQLCHDIVSSFMSYDMKPSERIYRIWRAVYFIRIWRESIKSSKRHTLKDHFITPNAFKCIEMNARNLIDIIRIFRENNESHLFIPTLMNSQTCEKAFRQFRSMGTANYTKINFSILELLYMVRRIEALNNILHFKLLNKGIGFPKFEVQTEKTKHYVLPLENEIEDALKRAKVDAVSDASKFKMVLDEEVLLNYEIFTYSSEACEFEDEDQDEYTPDDPEYDGTHDVFAEYEPNIFHDEHPNQSSCEDKRFIEISCPNGMKKLLRKSTLIWQFTDNNTKISNDRLKRVQVSNGIETDIAFHVNKRRRQSIS